MTDNEIIAEFMGVRHIHMVKNMGYDTCWRWLMNVVERIEQTPLIDHDDGPDEKRIIVTIEPGYVVISVNGENTIVEETVPEGRTKIQMVYSAIVDYIKWFNNVGGRLAHADTFGNDHEVFIINDKK